MKVAVVGAGVMGCAAAWALRERGAEVTVHEQFGLDHDRGSSHGRTRIFRVAYPEPYWVRFAQQAYAGWQELDPSLLGLYGLIELVADPALTSARALDECGVPHRLLDKDEVRAQGANLPQGWAALYIPDAGVVFADRACHAFLETAGVEVETNRRIESTDELDADVVVVTAGPWIRDLVPDVPVTVTRETVAYFKREGPPPPSIVDLNAETGGHGMYSLHDPVHGLKAGAHHAGAEADPDLEGSPDPAIVERIACLGARALPRGRSRPRGGALLAWRGRHGVRAVRARHRARVEPRPHADLPARRIRTPPGCELAQEALAGWRELEQQSGRERSRAARARGARVDTGAARRVTHSAALGVEHLLARAGCGTCARRRGAAGLDRAPPGVTRESFGPISRSPRSSATCRWNGAASSRSTTSRRTSSS